MPKRTTEERDELDPTPFKIEDDTSSVSVKSEDDVEEKKLAPGNADHGPAKRSRGRPGSKAWTTEDLDQLFTAMISGKTAKALEGQVNGRTGHQCLSTWK
ncbi:hypothetical protein A1Q2_04062 [Trichosporon asahii var. asahii CBS 8904]|jgi:hypothetical protein|uniref:Myb-like domain-containing protein n=2 Tax=Trichosporon asahii var. asahii TaxID=189963 RepID=K1VLV2_TRIAC|nr:hypothetical protein A1Q1_00202 [Trichosporon asahii var. asahii CBS 2479]EJT50504.1 hypothetical protein A1Q1_00202 [Trichosporon asahii var. asahii CBS 2479]EKD01691.1 hypothetical protein A1Q2_04062 [Trichosporon asahii var. asahii CBS 8904]